VHALFDYVVALDPENTGPDHTVEAVMDRKILNENMDLEGKALRIKPLRSIIL
jgi:hypothetical protein